jgi:hypothetical protein
MAKKAAASTAAVYKMIEVVGTSPNSWDEAAKNAIETAGKTLRDLRVAEVITQDIKVDGAKLTYRTRLSLSFKYHGDE